MAEAKLALTEVGTNEVEIMVFYLDLKAGDDTYRAFYGVNVAKVLKIMRMPEQVMTPPEASHPAVLGAFHFKDRGKIVPLVGLARYLKEVRVEGDEQKIIVTEFNQVMTAFLVSGITRIHRLSWKDIGKPDRLTDRYSGNAFTGVVKLEGQIVFILDLEKVVLELNPQAAKAFFGVRLETTAERTVNVLHVDDQQLVRRMVKHALEQDKAFRVDSAESGQDALDQLRRKVSEARDKGVPLNDLVNVVVTDVEMPVMDGFTLCRTIKDDPELKSLPVFLFSSLITEETRHRGESVRCDGQFPKPQTEAMAKDIISQLAAMCLEQ
jgi:two-component system chemotaxis response regulator CheV